jgi:predicted O-methyltransferase YrrM
MADATLHITEIKASSSDRLSSAFQQALQAAIVDKGEMDKDIYSVKGFCGKKFRLFLNNLVRELSGTARYLEVGVFAGATLCPIMSGNKVTATVIDNWSWDKDNTIAAEFYRNVAKFKNNQSALTIIEGDFHQVPTDLLGKFNIYFYDGDHREKDQYDGIVWAMNALDTQSIVLVDDWNWSQVRAGTMNALHDVGAKIEYMIEVRTSFDDEIPSPSGGGSDWHNGFFGAVISKSSNQ